MKVFWLNGRKVAAVECGIATSKCPVVCFMHSNGIVHNVCENSVYAESKKACLLGSQLRENIMNICMECNVPER